MLLVCYNIAVWMDLPGTVCIKCGLCVSGFHSAQQLSDGWTEAAVTTNFCLTGCSVCCRRARGTAVCDSRDQWGLLTFSLTSTSFFDLGKAALFRQVPKGWRCDPGAHCFLPGPLWCHREMLLVTHSQWCHGEGGDGLSWASWQVLQWRRWAGTRKQEADLHGWWRAAAAAAASCPSPSSHIVLRTKSWFTFALCHSLLCFIIPDFTVTQLLMIQTIKT